MQVDKFGLPVRLSFKEKLNEFAKGITFGLIAFGIPFLAVLYKSGALKGII